MPVVCPNSGAKPLVTTFTSRTSTSEIGSSRRAAPGVTVELTGGHTAGHAVVRIGDGAVFVGHLAVSPVNVVADMRPGSHEDRAAALVALEDELAAAAGGGRLVIGPLWPAPGVATVSGPPWVLTPYDSPM